MREFFNEKTQKRIDSLLSEINQTNDEFSQLKKALAVGLYRTAEPLSIVELTYENYNRYFARGEVQSPIESVKMGEKQFAKLIANNRTHLLDSIHKTLTTPSIIFNTITFDEHEKKLKPLHIYGKAFYSQKSERSCVVKSIIVFKENKNISISSHQNRITEFLKQMNSMQDLIYVNKDLIEKTSVVLKQTDAFIDLNHINTRPINLAYDEKNLFIEHSFGEKTKTAGENLRPNDSSAQNEVGSRARPLETVKDRNRAFMIEGYDRNQTLSSEKSDSGKNPLDRFLEEKGLKNTQQEIKESKNKGFEL